MSFALWRFASLRLTSSISAKRTGVPVAFLLQEAIYSCSCPAVEWLLDAGADIEAVDDHGLMPLRQAI